MCFAVSQRLLFISDAVSSLVQSSLGSLRAQALAGGADITIRALKTQEGQPGTTAPPLPVFAYLVYMERSSGEEGHSQEALRRPLGPASGPKAVPRKQRQQSSKSKAKSISLMAGTNERYKWIPKVFQKLVNGR